MKPCYHTSNAKQYHSKHKDLAAKMRTNPGRWFKVGVYNNRHTADVMRSLIRTGNARAHISIHYGPPFEAQVRGESTVWARYPR